MKQYSIAVIAMILGLTSVKLSASHPRQDFPDCTSMILYFKISGIFTNCELAAQSLTFPIPNDDSHVAMTNLEGRPFACLNNGPKVCCIGYDLSEIVLNPVTNHWELLPGKTCNNFRCCVKRSMQ